jgi:hypothetical protein
MADEGVEYFDRHRKRLVHGGAIQQMQMPSPFDCTRKTQDVMVFRKVVTVSK